MLLKDNCKILFQGDSITDSYRSATMQDGRFFIEEDLGTGYPKIFAAIMAAKYPAITPKYYNRAISGNRTIDLVNRWENDCLAINPDILVMMIGINDVWRKMDSNDPTSTEQFIANYKYLLESTKKQNPNVKSIVIEPCYYNPPNAYTKSFRTELIDKIEALRVLCKEMGCYYIALDGILSARCTRDDFTKWVFDDGVHLTNMGHGLLALELIKLFEANE